jgi:hypothetical protein
MSLKEIYNKYQSTNAYGDKGTTHRYIQTYERLFSPLKEIDITLLEIGVSHGHSLKMWREYFNTATIMGIDLNYPTLELAGCEFHICDQTNEMQIIKILNGRKLDIVIDDGSHRLQDQLSSFCHIFPFLKMGGMYIIEDIQDPAREIPVFKERLGDCEVVDTRSESGRYDDILLIWKK